MKYRIYQVDRFQLLIFGLVFIVSGVCQTVIGILTFTSQQFNGFPFRINAKGTAIWSGILTLLIGLLPFTMAYMPSRPQNFFKFKYLTVASSASMIVTNCFAIIILHAVEWRDWVEGKYGALFDNNRHRQNLLAAYLTPTICMVVAILSAIFMLAGQLSNQPWNSVNDESGLEKLTRLERYMHVYNDLTIPSIQVTQTAKGSSLLDGNSKSRPNISNNENPGSIPHRHHHYGLPVASVIVKSTQRALSTFPTTVKDRHGNPHVVGSRSSGNLEEFHEIFLTPLFAVRNRENVRLESFAEAPGRDYKTAMTSTPFKAPVTSRRQ